MKAPNTPNGQEKAREARLTRLAGNVQVWHPSTYSVNERRTVHLFSCEDCGLSITKTENLTSGETNYLVEIETRHMDIKDLEALAIAIQAARESAVFAEAYAVPSRIVFDSQERLTDEN